MEIWALLFFWRYNTLVGLLVLWNGLSRHLILTINEGYDVHKHMSSTLLTNGKVWVNESNLSSTLEKRNVYNLQTFVH